MTRLKVEEIQNIQTGGCEVVLRDLRDGTRSTLRIAISPNLQADKILDHVKGTVKALIERHADVENQATKLVGAVFEVDMGGRKVTYTEPARGGGEAEGGTAKTFGEWLVWLGGMPPDLQPHDEISFDELVHFMRKRLRP